MEDFIGKEFPQNCGDILKVIKKSDKKYYSNYFYECEFIKYPYKCLTLKQNILKGKVLNPQIEQVEFIDKIWPQNCGDDLKIIRKSIGDNNKSFYECEFLKYPYKIIINRKDVILKGQVNNPEIENQEFIGKVFPQNCGDDLKVLEKTNNKIRSEYLFKCEFQKNKNIVLVEKSRILRGSVFNTIINNDFIGKEFPQNCGDTLKVINCFIKDNITYYECEFIKYPNKIIITNKNHLINGLFDNPLFPWKSKENLIKYIQDNFKDKKPTLKELADLLNIAICTISQKINEFELREYISYYPSNKENILKNYIKELNITFIQSYWDKDIQREIDIYIPNLKLGFEFNGNFWHSNHEKYGRKNNYHQEKSLLAQEKGINLIHIFEYEINEKENLIKSLIKLKLGIFKEKIFARKCEIKEIQYSEYAQFCNKNHLQGECGAKIKLGLFYKNELVQVMSFGSPRFTNEYEYEIIRECSKLGYIIIGGKEKLWSYFLKKFNPSNCISYCDFSKFTGNSYLKLGFKKERLNKPGFVWYDNSRNQIFLRTPWKHKKMKDEGYLKIYDAGQLVFVWNK